MQRNTMKERFSLAFIGAVASKAGFHIDEPRVDSDSVDGTLRADFGRRPRMEFQAKATSQDSLRDSHLSFHLPVNNYEDLRVDEPINPRILIVLLMPKDESQWLCHTREELCLRYCAYWKSLEGKPPTQNTTTIAVQIPVCNIFNSGQLSELMEKAERGESL